MKEKPNYYAIIPAVVRYDKNITANAKLLYGEITSLCDKEGYCWATNDYFAKLYGVSKTSISIWIKSLIDNGYIESQLIYKEGSKEILNRYLKIIKEGYLKNLKGGIKENLKDNNINYNNTSININNNNIYEFIEQNFCRTLNPLEYEEVSKWEDNELTRYAIKEAVLSGKYNIKYISVVLHNYKMNNIKTVQQAQEEKERFKNKGKKEEPVPSWFNQEIKKEDGLTDEQRRDFEEWKKQI